MENYKLGGDETRQDAKTVGASAMKVPFGTAHTTLTPYDWHVPRI